MTCVSALFASSLFPAVESERATATGGSGRISIFVSTTSGVVTVGDCDPPLAVMTLVYITSPQYIELLWTHPTGQFMMAGCGVWMSLGVFVMRKMINFDF